MRWNGIFKNTECNLKTMEWNFKKHGTQTRLKVLQLFLILHYLISFNQKSSFSKTWNINTAVEIHLQQAFIRRLWTSMDDFWTSMDKNGQK